MSDLAESVEMEVEESKEEDEMPEASEEIVLSSDDEEQLESILQDAQEAGLVTAEESKKGEEGP